MKEPGRIILLRKYGEGALDCFYDLLFLEPGRAGDYSVEASIEGDPYDMELNEYGETRVGHIEGVSTGEQLFKAISAIMCDPYDRWENIAWTWDEIIQNLGSADPGLAQELSETLISRASEL